ncbi:MAG TPA: GNAT family N-acetyltransferase [Actinomycetota bacterium]|nr:GNAT family N-acetyltransferase [Actinomycetota bacterium]
MTIIDSGLTVRAAREEDFSRLTRFIHLYDTTVGDFSDFTEEDLREFSRMKGFEFATGSWLVENGAEIVAFGLAWSHGPGLVCSFGIVHPGHTGHGLGTICCDRAERRAEELLAPGGGVLRSFVDIKDEAGRALLTRRGYTVVRRQYTMVRGLPAQEVSPVPDGVTIRSAREDEGPLLHTLVEETFAGHWAHVPRTYEEFNAVSLQRADTDPGLWFIAEAHGEPVGLLIAAIDGSQGWVADLGVLDRWRRRGIGAALLTRAFEEFTKRGATEVGLGVDASNATGAVRLYESVGMSARKVYEVHDLPIPAQ